MLKHLTLKGVGPADTMAASMGPRLNVFTGDNGLGKTFLLDVAWWALSRKWATAPALPHGEQPSIEYEVQTSSDDSVSRTVPFDFQTQSWQLPPGPPHKPGLVIFAQVDGGYAVWDPARNYWRSDAGADGPQRPAAYQFTANHVWNGLRDGDKFLCNGLVTDWAGWQKGQTEQYHQLQRVLRALSPSDEELLTAGELTRVSLDDVRDIPTVRMPYGQDVPVLHCSAGIKRILALAYLLVWSWQEHVNASALLREETTTQAILIIDEIEGHLHPRWQRKIFPALLQVMTALLERNTVGVQVLAATHSPLILASLEPIFDETQDRLFDLALEDGKVNLSPMPWRKYGDVNNWLTSEIFQLRQPRSLEAEQALEEAARLLADPAPDEHGWRQIDAKLRESLSDSDSLWTRWNYVAERRGWVK